MIVAIDNGVTGTIAAIWDNVIFFDAVPVKKELSYTKTKQNISRIDYGKLYTILKSLQTQQAIEHIILERPMVNPTRWKASQSAIRALEATLICIENLELPYSYIDSKEWQNSVLPAGLKKEELKKASLDVGNRLFPTCRVFKHPDRDSLLMAYYYATKVKK